MKKISVSAFRKSLPPPSCPLGKQMKGELGYTLTFCLSMKHTKSRRNLALPPQKKNIRRHSSDHLCLASDSLLSQFAID